MKRCFFGIEALKGRGSLSFGRFALLACLLALTGCRQHMADQPYYRPLDPSDFFPDGMSARSLPPDTVPRGTVRGDASRDQNGVNVEQFPIPHRPCSAGARTGPLQYLLRSMSRGVWLRRRDDRSTRLLPAAVLPHRSTAPGAGRLPLWRGHQRPRINALVCRTGPSTRPMGDHRLHPRASAKSERRLQRSPRRRASHTR